MRRVAILLLALAVCASLSACGSSAPSASSVPRAVSKVSASILAAALAQKSVHGIAFYGGDFAESGRVTSDVTANSGTQRFAINGVGTANFRLVNDIVYVEGNPGALEHTLNLSKRHARAYAGQWISIPKGDRLYTRTADGLTLASLVRGAMPPLRDPSWMLKVVRRTAHGRRLVVLQDDRMGFVDFTFSARSGGERLPVSYSWNAGPGQSGSYGHFSNWNEPVHVHAPARSIPIATVRG